MDRIESLKDIPYSKLLVIG